PQLPPPHTCEDAETLLSSLRALGCQSASNYRGIDNWSKISIPGLYDPLSGTPPQLLNATTHSIISSPLPGVMQSFRERGGFHGNQHCYQQEPQELSRLESYRHHYSQSRQGYEPHVLAAAGMPTAGAGSKDCYGQQAYPAYSGTTQTKKPYRGAKTPAQHLQAGYSNHMGTGYTAQYMSEGHLQQKWDESAQMTQFEQDMVGRLESGVSGSSPYLEQNILAISQNQCNLPSQSSAPSYTSPHQSSLPPNPAQSPLMYPQGQLHYTQLSQPLSSSSSSYMEEFNTMSHSYKGYGIPPNTQYARQMSNHSSIKQSGYRQQNNYSYQQTASRSGFDQSSLQGMPGTPETLQKFQHYGQAQPNYCITDISVRSPEQYYQTCSPSSSHSPARSVGRSPSYNSTPSPLMQNPDTFQYGQPPINPGTSSSTALQDQNMLGPPQNHSSPNANHQSGSFSGSMKERFSEKLLSNPSLWSLNALTSQVENISNNVQQLLLSEALIANKKTSKRNNSKKGDDYRGQLKSIEDSSTIDNQLGPPPSDAYNITRSMTAGLQEGGYCSSTEDQIDRSYYYFGQEKGQAQSQIHSRLSLDTVSTCSLNSTDDVSVRSGDSVRSLQSVASEESLNSDQRVQRALAEEEPNSSYCCIRDEKSPISVTTPSPMKQESNSPADMKCSEITQKENFEESVWSERVDEERMKEQKKQSAEHECKGQVIEKQEKWLDDEKGPSLFHRIKKAASQEGYSFETEEHTYQGLENRINSDKRNSEEVHCVTEPKPKLIESPEIKSENVKTEPQAKAEMLEETSTQNSTADLYFPEKEEPSKIEKSAETPICSDTPEDSVTPTELREVQESLTTSEEVINKREQPQEYFAEAYSTFEEMGKVEEVEQVNTEMPQIFARNTPHRDSERRSVICDIAPHSHTAMSGFSALNEKTTPLVQARDHHIDRSDAKVLEPDSPQLPGKSILHSAPSWADTPPSPKKGDEDMEPGISCPSAVTPSAKQQEPVSPSCHTRIFSKKHVRGRRRSMQSTAGTRRQIRMGDAVPPSAQTYDMSSSKGTLISDQLETTFQSICSQTPQLQTESLPSRMCTRSRDSQINKKISPQEKKKPGPKPGAKTSIKPGPKTNPKPGPKPVPKSIAKLISKPDSISIAKPGPKPSLKRTGLKKNSKPGPKSASKPGSKCTSKNVSKVVDFPGELIALKSSEPTDETKSSVESESKGPGRPKGIGIAKVKSKSRSIKQDETAKDHTRNTHCTQEIISQDVTPAITIDTIVNSTKDETVPTTIEPIVDSSSINSLLRDQKSMVLRSRKQPKEKGVEEKEKNKSKKLTSHVVVYQQMQDIPLHQLCSTDVSTFELPEQSEVFTNSLQQPEKKIVAIKRQCRLKSTESQKRRKSVQECQINELEAQLDTVSEVLITKGKRTKVQCLPAESVSTTITPEPPICEDISDVPSVSPHCPAKTKYLPPRKGRGLKYEAMVQKITSPASKKAPLNLQMDSIQEDSTSKPVPQLPEDREATNTEEVTQKDSESKETTQQAENSEIQTPRKKKRKWATVESNDAIDAALVAGSLVINTPRLAKQRAIKNNHEMHLKQRKKRKNNELQENIHLDEKKENEHTEMDIVPAPPSSSSLTETNEQTDCKDSQTDACMPLVKPKRGRRSTLKKKEGLLSQKDNAEVAKRKKTGPKKSHNLLKIVVRRPKRMTKSSKNIPPTVKGTFADLHPVTGESKCSFRPYVHIGSSLNIASFCTIVNRPEEEQNLSQVEQKCVAKTKNVGTVTKALVNSSAMLQGPLVNRRLTERCLTCCLCGKPANYRELGDLCGPYYPEDCIPRKMLSTTHRNDFRQNSNCANETDVISITKTAQSKCEKGTLQEGADERHSRHPKRGKRALREQLRLRPTLGMRLKSLLLLQRRLGGASPPAGEEGSITSLQRQQNEAEANEHWAHEACTVWTTGIILVADKLFGLTEAVQNAAHNKCSGCQGEGASICCSGKNCNQWYHYICAKETGCTFQEETFSIRCPKHKMV
ncbi:hypothetical protein DNTS_001227, partial [Danionella cerebrum]